MTHCIRCGKCCLESSPTLQISDVGLVVEGFIEKSCLYTIREGEIVRDPIEKRLLRIDRELVKIKEKPSGQGCLYYDHEGKSCTIYDHRPAQCRAFACWDPEEFFKVYEGPRVSRDDILTDDILRELVHKHDTKCGYGELEGAVRQIEYLGEKAVERVLELLKFDHDLRPLAHERLGIDESEMDFFLGRPFTETLFMFGLQVKKEPDGSFLLTVLDDSDPS